MDWMSGLLEFFVIVYGPVVLILLVMLIVGGLIFSVVSFMVDFFYS